MMTDSGDVYRTPGKGVFAAVPNSAFKKQGKFSVFVLVNPTGTKVELGTFEVLHLSSK